MSNKILFCATVDYHLKAFHLPYMEWFSQQSWEVHVASNGHLDLPFVNKKYNLPIQRSPFHMDNYKAYHTLVAIITENQYQMIHCHTPLGGVLARLAARKARKSGTKVIYTAHGFHFCQDTPIMNWIMYYPIEKSLAHLTDCLITINDEDYSLAKRKKFKAKRIERVHGVGVNTDDYKPVSKKENSNRRKQFGYEPEEFLLFFAAEFNKNKNHQLLIRALAIIKDQAPQTKLIFAGAGPLQEDCRAMAIELGMEHMVHFLGYRKDIMRMLPICDAVVSSSLREGLPVNIMEAMACGLPIIATENRGHKELIEDQMNGYLIKPDNVTLFAHRMLEIIQSQELRQCMGNESIERISKYSLTQVGQEMKQIYVQYKGSTHDVGNRCNSKLVHHMKNPMRILHVVVNMNRGGAETLIMNLYRNIDRSAIQFDFLTCKHGVYDDEIIELGGKVFQMDYITDIGHMGYVKELNQFFHDHPEYNLIHSHMDKMSGLVLQSARKAGVPVRIAHSHNTRSEGGIAAKLYKWYAGNKIIPASTHLLACSQAAAKWLYSDKSKAAVILRNGIDCERFAYSPDNRQQMREQLGLAENTYVLGHVGRFANQKNHQFLLKTFEQLQFIHQDCMLILAGDGPLRKTIELRAAKLGLMHKVRFLGIRNDIERLLQAFDVFVFPSFHEGLPVTLIEAQGAGLPCVISDRITAEVDMGAGLIHFEGLNRSPLEWAIKVMSVKKEKHDAASTIKDKGYDIRSSANWIKQFYMEAVR